MVGAPAGVDLKAALSEAISLHLDSSSSSMHGGTASSHHHHHQLHSSLPGTPAPLPCGLSSGGGTPLVLSQLGGSPQSGTLSAEDGNQHLLHQH